MKCFLILFFCAHTWAAPLNIIIDPGHGGNDKGATSGSAQESDLTLKLSQKIISLIQDKHADQIQARTTRTRNHYVSLPQRVQFLSEEQPDLYLSLHYNSAFSESLSGTEVYFPQENKPATSLTVLDFIKQDLIETGRVKKSLQFSQMLSLDWPMPTLKLRRAPFYILEKSSSPVVLIEVGYLTNPAEQKRLLSAQTQDAAAESIVKALLNFKEIRDNSVN